ncbi:plastocyanin/azurin family copper-binding protein [Pontibacter sp. MBLB2868]|uniref:plastocyanin/azurin family copper-binding protein n=1 Tax=Pontibacter sp. MBLB2868 TaxID=3451555 RepID=UPI003F756F62
MKRIFSICCLSYLLLLTGCFEKNGQEQSGDNIIDADTATASSAPIIENPDTTLQPIQELKLVATGNTLDEIAYKQDTLEVNAGALVKLTFVNEGVDMPMVHNVVITKPGMYKEVALAGAKVGASGNYVPESPVVIAASSIALPGQTVELEFTAPAEPGSYDFVCTYPGHWPKMHGVFIIKPNQAEE